VSRGVKWGSSSSTQEKEQRGNFAAGTTCCKKEGGGGNLLATGLVYSRHCPKARGHFHRGEGGDHVTGNLFYRPMRGG